MVGLKFNESHHDYFGNQTSIQRQSILERRVKQRINTNPFRDQFDSNQPEIRI